MVLSWTWAISEKTQCKRSYWKSSSLSSNVSGDNLFCGNLIRIESLGFNESCFEHVKELVVTHSAFDLLLCKGLKYEDTVLLGVEEFCFEARDSSGFLLLDTNMVLRTGFWISFIRLVFFASAIFISGLFDSIGTSFPSTWLVKTNDTWNNEEIVYYNHSVYHWSSYRFKWQKKRRVGKEFWIFK